MVGEVLLQSLQAKHDDYVHDVAYDHFGTRMATCSSDQTLRIWDKNDSGKWEKTGEWKGHQGSVWKVAWAHPEFGQLLATCSFDHSVIVWEEAVEGGRHNMARNTRTWQQRVRLMDSKASVLDVQFAPRHLGLRLAACDAEGMVRIYQVRDVMNLSEWPAQEFSSGLGCCRALDWNTSPFDPPMVVVGGRPDKDADTSAVKIFEFNEAAKKWQLLARLGTGVGVQREVQDVAWAPNLGRSYHLVAAASADGNVYLWRVTLPSAHIQKANVQLLETFTDHASPVWRVQWNVTGTILGSSGDDGRVRTWKAVGDGRWEQASCLRPQ